MVEIKTKIQDAVKNFNTGNLTTSSLNLFKTLGYPTDRQNPFSQKTYQTFKNFYLEGNTSFNEEKAFAKTDWKYIDLLFQISEEEVKGIKAGRFNDKDIHSFLFFTIELTKSDYSRTALSQITREVNKVFPMPVMILFKYGFTLTLSIINRRLHKKDEQKDVLEKVTLIKDIKIPLTHIQFPLNKGGKGDVTHRAHIEILFDLSFDELLRKYKVTNFVELHNGWQKTLDTKELNKRFYRDLSYWYFWAMKEVNFPSLSFEADKTSLFNQEDKVQAHNAKNLIRLLTRLLFVWFIKEKNLIPEELFDAHYIKDTLLKEFEPKKKKDFEYDKHGSTYYRAILQNLFFATLNQSVGKREFRKDGQHMNVTNLMRYERYFKNPKTFLKLMEDIVPFMNGGLFECLDSPDPILKGKKGGDIILYEDGFSDKPDNTLCVPDYIFFGLTEHADLREVLGDKKSKDVAVRGLINILKSYKFTVTENTPIEEDIALDPELLGRVFENLLASYNPETKTTARKQTGSFYTPREIVNYMVDESLKAYLKQKLETEAGMTPADSETGLELLIGYNEKEHQFDERQTAVLIKAVDTCKILDPACGSGAFPMGILHKMVHILDKLDPKNRLWKERQIEKAQAIDDAQIRDNLIADIETAFNNNELDYGRKLYLIENCIYGVDIQPIAIQISKLRFFISLIVDEKADKIKDNFGIRPLPNLETKFVAANTLIGIDKPKKGDFLGTLFDDHTVNELEKKLKDIRHRLFSAKTPATKRKLREEDKILREKMGDLLITSGWGNDTARLLAGWDPYDQNASSPFFDAEWMFGIKNPSPILGEGRGDDGFDVVIGNPPYGAKFTNDEKEYFKRNYNHQDYQPESFLFFTEKSFDLIKIGAVVSYIIPNTWLTNLKLKKIRKYLTGNNSILNISHYHKSVFDAVVDTEVVIFKRGYIANNVVKIFNHVDIDDVQEITHLQEKWEKLNGDVINIFSDEKIEKIISRIRTNSFPISDFCNVITGMKPYQVGKGVPKQDKSIVEKRIFDSESKIDKHYKKLLRGKDIDKYEIKWEGKRWIKFGDWLAEPRYSANFDAKEKIAIRQTGDSLIATIDDRQFVFMNNLHVLNIKSQKSSLRFTLALLNSSLLNFYFQYLNPEDGEALAEVKKENVEKLLIKKASDEKPFIVIVDYILFLKKAVIVSATFFQCLIDSMVYELYLPEEIKSADCEVLKHLSNLPELKEEWDEAKKLQTIEKIYKEFSDPAHPATIAMEKMQEVPEVRIVEGLDK